ncbi:hypothetical protein [Brevibacillus marinus]|mgnify:CR=1 FL=1|uniref:hypothetical protein n=1 Tax=Brevibacillus marinus TaxID=2496837 RepID=UPI000F8469C6|nr:hypothetical protein [Brevibacillus marinus]
MTLLLPLFLIAAGLLVIWQPRTKRWQQRLLRQLRDEHRVKQRARTFVLLGSACILAGFALLFRLIRG